MSQARILVVEDDNLVALDICQSLESFGYEVETPVNNGDLALQRAQETRPDVVLMDIQLSGASDGVTAAAQISDSTDIPIIFLTAHADKATLDRAKIVEPSGYIVKPFEEVELHAAIQMVLYKTKGLRSARDNGAGEAVELAEDGTCVDLAKRFMQSIPFFSGVRELAISQLAHVASEILLAEGEVLPIGDDERAPVFLVVSGRISMQQKATSGKELIVELVGPKDLFGLLAAIDKAPSGLQAVANRDSKLLLIPRKSFVLFLEAHPHAALRFTEYAVSRLRALQQLTKSIAYDDVYTRIACVVWALLLRSEAGIPEEKSCTIEITRSELAKLSGTRVETVVRVLKSLEEKGAVSLGQRKRLEISSPSTLRSLLPEAEVWEGLQGLAPTTGDAHSD